MLSYFAELADSVIQAAEERRLTVLIEQTATTMRRCSTSTNRSCCSARIFGGPTDHVTMKNVEAARAATEHLIALGRRRIAVVGAHEGEVIGSAGLRLRGYREALEAAGVPCDPALIGYTTLWHRANGATSMRALLATGVQLDTVFGLNDSLALGAMRVLQESGLSVPEDVAVIGFDDLDESQYSLPALSTVDPVRAQIAETAVDLLFRRIRGKERDAEPAREVFVNFRMVQRESS